MHAAGGSDSYPRQLENILNEMDIGMRFSVINGGRHATHSIAILERLEDNLNKYKPDMVITMIGANDGLLDHWYENKSKE